MLLSQEPKYVFHTVVSPVCENLLLFPNQRLLDTVLMAISPNAAEQVYEQIAFVHVDYLACPPMCFGGIHVVAVSLLVSFSF